MINDFIAAFPLALLYGFATGPVFFIVIQLALEGRGKEAFILDIGCVIADIIILILGYWGLRSFLIDIRLEAEIYTLGGCVFIAYGLYQVLKRFKPTSPQPIQAKTVLKALFKGFILNLFNITGIGYWITLLVLFSQRSDQAAINYISFFGTILLVYLLLSITKIALASHFNSFMVPEKSRIFEKMVGILLILVGISIAINPYL